MKTFYRSVWICDVHLCTRDSQADLLYSFLDSIKVDYLYLVGDIIDMWSLKKKCFGPTNITRCSTNSLNDRARGQDDLHSRKPR